MAAYQFEFDSALGIGGNNLSQSAGFESIAHTYHTCHEHHSTVEDKFFHKKSKIWRLLGQKIG